jgi:hypothetical protein
MQDREPKLGLPKDESFRFSVAPMMDGTDRKKNAA